MDYFLISLIHSFTPIFIIILFVPFMGKSFNEEKWTVGKELILLTTFLLLIGIVQFLLRDLIYDNPNNWSWRYLFEEIRNTFLVGILLFAIIVPLNQKRLDRQNKNTAKTLSLDNNKKSIPANLSEIFIKTHLKGDDFILNIEHFLFARAEGNYVTLYVKNEKFIDKHLKRISIKDLESQLRPLLNILRTHRSYLVNLHSIKSIKGNAQGYRLELKGCEKFIPVSRKMIPLFQERLRAI